ncbi:hypothetical protein [Sphingomonas sp. Leaf33]|uniref:hypothetical protein n=1 Tax=Sphingomonas sp. Leaf33 TaxID=1736215 RepID=UPI000A967037|nr:hypothetical protein [Sphingomonas sp. Leaf33]
MGNASVDFDYYQRRAEAQLELAQKSIEPAAVAAHVTIAERYLELCEPARLAEVAEHDGPRLSPIAA